MEDTMWNRAAAISAAILTGLLHSNAIAQVPNIPVAPIASEQSETAIAQSNSNPNLLIAAWNDFPAGDPPVAYSRAGYSFSTDAGNTWQMPTILVQPYTSGFDPSVAFNGSTALYCRGVNFGVQEGERGGQIYLSYTSDRVSWTDRAVSSSDVKQDKPYIAVDKSQTHNGRAYVSWVDFSEDAQGRSYIRLKYADPPNYNNWQGPAQVAMEQGGSTLQDAMAYPMFPVTNEAAGAFVQGPVPVVGPDGTVYVAWIDFEAKGKGQFLATGSIYVAKSTDGGQTFPTVRRVVQSTSLMWEYSGFGTGLRISSFPTIAVNPANNYLYLAYTFWSGSTTDIYYARSVDAGASWTVLGSATAGTGDHEFFPWLSVSPSGSVFLAYYRGYAQSGLIDLFLARDFAAPDTKVSSPNGMNPSGVRWPSDYIGIVALTGLHAVPLWTDYRNSSTRPDIYCGLFGAPSPPTGVVISGSPGQHPTISWAANPEPDLSGYRVYRYLPPFEGVFHEVATVGSGTTSFTDTYIYVNSGTGNPTAYYYVKAYDAWNYLSDASSTVSVHVHPPGWPKIVPDVPERPIAHQLFDAYPNPFNPSTTIRYALSDDAHILVSVYNTQGQELATLINGVQSAGYYETRFTGEHLASGIYFVRMTVSNTLGREAYRRVTKLLLTK